MYETKEVTPALVECVWLRSGVRAPKALPVLTSSNFVEKKRFPVERR